MENSPGAQKPFVDIKFRDDANVPPEASKFLEVLNKEQRVVFDWSIDKLSVEDNSGEPDKNTFSLSAYDFEEMAGIEGFSHATTVANLLKLGLAVEIKNHEAIRDVDRMVRLFKEDNVDVSKLTFAKPEQTSP